MRAPLGRTRPADRRAHDRKYPQAWTPRTGTRLKGPNDETRVLHINPWGNVMPFGGPWRRTG